LAQAEVTAMSRSKQYVSRLTKGWRLMRVGLHIGEGLVVSGAFFPLMQAARRKSIQQAWSRQLLRILGVRLEASGEPAQGGLLVSNHMSWLDVFVINAVVQATFVCKIEVRSWPAIGRLCANTGTIFIERGRGSAARLTNQTVVERLQQGSHVVVFPEGTSTDGKTMLPFRAAMFQAAVDSATCVNPFALRYQDGTGALDTAATYHGDLSFWESLCAIAARNDLVARIDLLPALTAENTTRRDLAEAAERTIRQALGHSVGASTVTADEDVSLSSDVPSDVSGAVSPAPTFAG